jgi:hypothetical protein
MAREERLVCDLCRRVTPVIAGKLFFTPTVPGNGGANNFHNRYELHLDVGVCCEKELRRKFNWRKRMTAKQYAKSRRKVPT